MEELRAQFPVLDRVAYLNAGTNGPIPRAALDAVERDVREQAEHGRAGGEWFERKKARIEELRGRIAALLGTDQAYVAITGSATDGVNAAIHALDLSPGDDVLTSDEEHPGVLGPLATLRETRGVNVRVAPFDELPDEVRPDTKLVVTSHVSWATGRVMDTAPLAASEAIVVLDAAQGLGAVPVDVRALGCHFYAAAGQKWLCGPNGLGYLYVSPELATELPAPWSGYHAMDDPQRALEPALHPDARRLSTLFPASHHVEWAHASLDVLEAPGIERVYERAIDGADRLVALLRERGVPVSDRGRSTLVSFEVPDPDEFAGRAAAERITIRSIPNSPHARASVGAWSSEDDLMRLAELAAAAG